MLPQIALTISIDAILIPYCMINLKSVFQICQLAILQRGGMGWVGEGGALAREPGGGATPYSSPFAIVDHFHSVILKIITFALSYLCLPPKIIGCFSNPFTLALVIITPSVLTGVYPLYENHLY